MSTLIDSYSESNYSTSWRLSSSNDQGVAQSFVSSSSAFKIASVKFYLSKYSSPTGNIVAKLYELTGTPGTNAIPNSSALATSDAISAATIGYDVLVTFNMSTPYAMSTNHNYCITLEYSGGDGNNYIKVGTDNTSPAHSGNFSRLNDGNWTAFSTTDMCFYVYGDAPATSNFFQFF